MSIAFTTGIQFGSTICDNVDSYIDKRLGSIFSEHNPIRCCLPKIVSISSIFILPVLLSRTTPILYPFKVVSLQMRTLGSIVYNGFGFVYNSINAFYNFNDHHKAKQFGANALKHLYRAGFDYYMLNKFPFLTAAVLLEFAGNLFDHKRFKNFFDTITGSIMDGLIDRIIGVEEEHVLKVHKAEPKQDAEKGSRLRIEESGLMPLQPVSPMLLAEPGQSDKKPKEDFAKQSPPPSEAASSLSSTDDSSTPSLAPSLALESSTASFPSGLSISQSASMAPLSPISAPSVLADEADEDSDSEYNASSGISQPVSVLSSIESFPDEPSADLPSPLSSASLSSTGDLSTPSLILLPSESASSPSGLSISQSASMPPSSPISASSQRVDTQDAASRENISKLESLIKTYESLIKSSQEKNYKDKEKILSELNRLENLLKTLLSSIATKTQITPFVSTQQSTSLQKTKKNQTIAAKPARISRIAELAVPRSLPPPEQLKRIDNMKKDRQRVAAARKKFLELNKLKAQLIRDSQKR
jgi:hypothetical protein